MPKKEAKNQFFNDWQSLAAKPESKQGKKFDDNVLVEPYKVKRPGSYLSMYPSDEGEKYAFAIVPDKDGKSFIMTEVMTIKRFKFRNPKTNEDYFENLKLPMDPKFLFDMSVVTKATQDPSSLTDEDKKVLTDIKRHADLVQRYKNLYWCDVEGINFGYAKSPTKYNNRLRKEALTGFFGITTKWRGEENSRRDFSVKFIQSRYAGFQDKFRNLLSQTSKTHDELQPSWYEDYFSVKGGVKGVIDVTLGSMKVGGAGATVKLVKLGKDPIEDKGVGVTGEIKLNEIKPLSGEANNLSHLHYYMGFDSSSNLWQELYVDRFEEAIVDLEGHVTDVKLSNISKGEATSEGSAASEAASNRGDNDDLPF